MVALFLLFISRKRLEIVSVVNRRYIRSIYKSAFFDRQN
jgi:hypothetical protein